jgi:hypothetical protein
MRSMTRMAVAGCMALAALTAVTVLGVGAPTAHAATSVSPFAGSWSGTWSIEDGPFGTFDWTISDAGVILGTVYSIPGDHTGAVVGHVGADGKLMFIGNVPGETPNEDGNGFAFKGTALIDGDGKLVVSAALAAAPFGWPLVAILERN